MDQRKFPYCVVVKDGELINFRDLAHLMAEALNPDDPDGMGYGLTRVHLDDDLPKEIESGNLIVRNRIGLNIHAFPHGQALQDAVILQQDLLPFLESRGIGLEHRDDAVKPAAKRIWDEAANRQLIFELNQTGATQTSVAKKYGVTRQFIGTQKKVAEDLLLPKKAGFSDPLKNWKPKK